jgi:hypothetical protein
MLAPAIWEVQTRMGHRVCVAATAAAQKQLRAGGVEVSCMIGDPDR